MAHPAKKQTKHMPKARSSILPGQHGKKFEVRLTSPKRKIMMERQRELMLARLVESKPGSFRAYRKTPEKYNEPILVGGKYLVKIKIGARTSSTNIGAIDAIVEYDVLAKRIHIQSINGKHEFRINNNLQETELKEKLKDRKLDKINFLTISVHNMAPAK